MSHTAIPGAGRYCFSSYLPLVTRPFTLTPTPWSERLRNDLFCVEWDVKPQLSQSIHWDDGGQRPHGGKRVEVTPLISPPQAFENQK